MFCNHIFYYYSVEHRKTYDPGYFGSSTRPVPTRAAVTEQIHPQKAASTIFYLLQFSFLF